jgi:hypothetical protein
MFGQAQRHPLGLDPDTALQPQHQAASPLRISSMPGALATGP